MSRRHSIRAAEAAKAEGAALIYKYTGEGVDLKGFFLTLTLILNLTPISTLSLTLTLTLSLILICHVDLTGIFYSWLFWKKAIRRRHQELARGKIMEVKAHRCIGLRELQTQGPS